MRWFIVLLILSGAVFAQEWDRIYEQHWTDCCGRIEFTTRQIGFMPTDCGLKRTNDGGFTWLDVENWPEDYSPIKVEFFDSLVGYCLVFDSLIAITLDGGNNWEFVVLPEELSFVSIWEPQFSFVNENRMIAAMSQQEGSDSRLRIWLSEDNAQTWITTYDVFDDLNGLYFNKPCVSTEGTVLVPIIGSGYLRSVDGGVNWDSLSSPAEVFLILASPAPGVFWGSRFIQWPFACEIYRSVDDGLNWDLSWPDNDPIVYHQLFYAEFPDSLHGWFGSTFADVVSTSDGGQSWTRSEIVPVTETTIESISFVDSTHGWAFRQPSLVEDGGIYAYGDAQNDAPVRPIVPQGYSLSTYPNPFNSTVRIDYELPRASDVELTVHNTLGQQVASLFSGRAQAGAHSVSWSPDAASGVYFVKLVSGDFTTSRKVLYIR